MTALCRNKIRYSSFPHFGETGTT